MDQTQPAPENSNQRENGANHLADLPVIEASSGAAPITGATPGRDRASKPSILDAVIPDVGTDARHAMPDDIDDEDAESQLAYQSLMRHRKERRRKKIVRAAIVLGILAAAGIFFWARSCQSTNQGTDLPTMQVDFVYRDDFRESISATGSARPDSSVIVNPGIEGTVTSVEVAAGDTVTIGQTLATIENNSLDKAVDEAWFSYKDAEAAVNEAQAALNEVWYGDDQAAKDSTYIALERAKAARDSALEAYQDAVDAAENRDLKAPISGTVITMELQVGQKLGEGSGSGLDGTGTIQIADLSQMRVTVEVSEIDITKVAIGQGATVTFSALPDVELDAEVVNIAAMSSGENGGWGAVTYSVELLIPKPDPALKPGMTASVRIDVQAIDDVLMVPTSALQTDDGVSYYVFVVTDYDAGEVEMRPVTVLAEGPSSVAVEGDLSEGDMVQIVTSWDTGFYGDDYDYASSTMEY